MIPETFTSSLLLSGAVYFFVETIKKRLHKFKSFHCQTPSGGRQHGLRKMPEFDQIFPVGGIFRSVGGPCQSFLFCVMHPGVAGTGKKESPSQTDSAQRVQFVGIKNDAAFGRFGPYPVPVAVAPDSFRNSASELFRQLFSSQEFQSHLCAALRMTYSSL